MGKKTQELENAPSARKIMQEKGIDPSRIQGSGRDGRVMKEDVLGQTTEQTSLQVEKANNEPLINPHQKKEERVKMSRLRQTIASRLKQAQNTAAMLTTYNEVDMSAIFQIRAVQVSANALRAGPGLATSQIAVSLPQEGYISRSELTLRRFGRKGALPRDSSGDPASSSSCRHHSQATDHIADGLRSPPKIKVKKQ